MVKLHDRLGEAEPQAGAWLRAAFLKPYETFSDAFPVSIIGDALAIVDNAEPDFTGISF